MQQQLHQKNEAAFKKYRMAIKESLSKPDNPVVTNEQVITCSTVVCAVLVFQFVMLFSTRLFCW